VPGFAAPGIQQREHRVVLGVEEQPQSELPAQIEQLLQRTVVAEHVRCGVVPGEEPLGGGRLPWREAAELVQVVRVHPGVQPEVDQRVALDERRLGVRVGRGPGGWPGVGHVDHRGEAAGHGRPARVRPVLLEDQSGGTEVHVRVDQAGQNVLAPRVEYLPGGRVVVRYQQRGDPPVPHGDVGAHRALRGHHDAPGHQKIEIRHSHA